MSEYDRYSPTGHEAMRAASPWERGDIAKLTSAGPPPQGSVLYTIQCMTDRMAALEAMIDCFIHQLEPILVQLNNPSTAPSAPKKVGMDSVVATRLENINERILNLTDIVQQNINRITL